MCYDLFRVFLISSVLTLSITLTFCLLIYRFNLDFSLLFYPQHICLIIPLSASPTKFLSTFLALKVL